MSTESKQGHTKTVLAWAAMTMPLALCIAIPLVVGVGAVGLLGGLRAAADNVWVTAVAIALPLVGIGWLLVRRARKATASDDCCVPRGSAPHQDAIEHRDTATR